LSRHSPPTDPEETFQTSRLHKPSRKKTGGKEGKVNVGKGEQQTGALREEESAKQQVITQEGTARKTAKNEL